MSRFPMLALAWFSAASPALASDRHEPVPLEQKLEKVDRWLERLDATDAQRDAIHALATAAEARRTELREEGQALKSGVSDLLWAEEIDRKGLEKLRERAVDLFERSTTFGMDTMISVAEVLTPEQRVRVHDLLAE